MSDIRIFALAHDEQNALDQCLAQWRARRPNNLRKSLYYDAHNAVQNLGIAVPQYLVKVGTVLGWPAKGVDSLARRIHLDGFVVPGQSDPFDISQLWDDNNLAIEAPQAHISSLIHTPTFITTTLGDVQSGEPEVMISVRDALSGTGLYDTRRRELGAFLSIVTMEEDGHTPSEMILYLPYKVLILRKGSLGTWQVERRTYSLGRIPAEPLVFNPRLGSPFGRSRISRPVRNLTDAAMRTVLRSEVGAEFFSGPQRVLLGADESAFQDEDGNLKTQWESIVGRIWAIPAPEDPDAEMPKVEQMPQVSMQPHGDHMRMFSQLIAAELNLPVSAFGIVQDQPASAESMDVVYRELVIEAETACDTFGIGWARSMQTGVILRDDLDEATPELKRLRSKFRDPATPSRGAATDAVVKQVQTGILPPDSDVTLEALGYDSTTIARIQADRRRSRGAALLASRQAVPATDPTLDALTVRRAPAEEV